MKICKEDILGIVGFIMAFAIVFLCCRECYKDYVKSSTFKYDVDVTYVYEGDDEEHHVYTTEIVNFNNTVKECSPVFTSEVCYTNAINLRCDFYADNRGYPSHSYVKSKLVNVPDRRVKVTGISWTSYPRVEHPY